MTLSLKYQKMYAGGSGVWEMTQVRLMVEPLLTWRSGDPWMPTWGTEQWRRIEDYKTDMLIITNDVQSDGIWLWWLGGNLTLVDTSISLLKLVSLTETETALTTHLDIFDQENPLVLSVVFWRESLVGGEGLLSSRQNMDITMSHPGHLYKVKLEKVSIIF